MGPHPDDFHCLKVVQYLVDETVLDINAARVSAGEVSDQFFVGREFFVGIPFQDFQKFFGLRPQARKGKFLGVFLSLLREDESPSHHLRAVSHFLTGVLSPFRIDSRIPGIDRR